MKRVLITGVAGEVGSSLAQYLARNGGATIIGFDVRKPSEQIQALCARVEVGDIADKELVQSISADEPLDVIFHLAGILSSGGERAPLKAHEVNVSGTLNILELARNHSERRGHPVQVIFTSTIAVYGITSLEDKKDKGLIGEEECLTPITMYGANKLYCESLGRYYAENFGMLEGARDRVRIDFRAVRFPGLLSAHTVPTGGTSDYAPEMVHAVARGLSYECFVRPDSRLPFMMMPDAVRALVLLSEAQSSVLSRRVYNVAGFAPSAHEIYVLLSEYFHDFNVTYNVHPARQAIVDSWPQDIDDSAARKDFGWAPLYSFEAGFDEYLLPAACARYGVRTTGAREFKLAAN